MEAIIGFFTAKLGWLAGGLGIGAGLFAAKKWLPGLVVRIVQKEVGKVLNPDTSDPVEKKLIQDLAVAAVKLAEYKIPDRGKGADRYKAAASWLTSAVPILKGKEDKIAEVIEGAVSAADEELKKISGGGPSGA